MNTRKAASTMACRFSSVFLRMHVFLILCRITAAKARVYAIDRPAMAQRPTSDGFGGRGLMDVLYTVNARTQTRLDIDVHTVGQRAGVLAQ